jgi:hypothetical protein
VVGAQKGGSLTAVAFDLEGSDHSPQIVGVDARSRFRINVLERSVQSRRVSSGNSGNVLLF